MKAYAVASEDANGKDVRHFLAEQAFFVLEESHPWARGHEMIASWRWIEAFDRLTAACVYL